MTGTQKQKTIQPIEFLWLGLYGFTGFSLELLLGFLVNTLGFTPLNKNLNSVLTGILWFTFAILLIQYAKRKFEFNVFHFKHQLSNKEFSIAFMLIILITIITFFGFGGFKPFVEFTNGSNKSILTYMLQIFYYLGESALIVLTIVFGQQFAEKQFLLNHNIPSGGVFLALTWGLMHFLLQGFSGGLFTVSFSILAGILYVLCKKDFKWSYLLIAAAFIL
ncbi:hypothetical protein ACYSNR_04770 [Enterococcus sp. LJL128]